MSKLNDNKRLLRHDPNDESHKGKIGVCLACLILEEQERLALHKPKGKNSL